MPRNSHFASFVYPIAHYVDGILAFEADCSVECDYIVEDGEVTEVNITGFAFETSGWHWEGEGDDRRHVWRVEKTTSVKTGLLHDLLVESLDRRDLENRVAEYHEEHHGSGKPWHAEHSADYRASVL